MATLSVNVDHVATLRQARGGIVPDPVTAAAIAELNGAAGIIVHLREDRRHIQDRDLRVLRETVKTRLNMEMATTEEMIGIAVATRPFMCTMVPEKRQELTTEGGLDVAGQAGPLAAAISRLHDAGILVSLFIDPVLEQIKASKNAGADFVELHTGRFADAATEAEADKEQARIVDGVGRARDLGLRVNLGHGINYLNILKFSGLSGVHDYSIGHAIISRAVLVGLGPAVREMADLVKGL